MDCRLLLLGIAILSKAQCQSTDAENSTTPATTGKTGHDLPQVCAVCNCTGADVSCVDKGLVDHFEAADWPKGPMDAVTFRGNTLIHLRPFPRLAIRRLILQDNQITRIEERAFKDLVNMTELDLSRNQLTRAILTPHVFEGSFSPESYEPLSKVTVLSLAGNDLHSLHQDLFEHLSGLKQLNLSGNPLEVIDIRTYLAISSLAYLEVLDLSHCQISTIPDHQFHTLKHLRELNLTGNRFASIPYSFEELEALERLYLDENPIKVLNYDRSFPHMPNLKELSLSSMSRLTTIGKGAFRGLTSLEGLRLRDCPLLNEIDESALIDPKMDVEIWPPLKMLDLSDNGLQYLPALLLARWDLLEELDLMNNKWGCDCNNQYLIGTVLSTYGKKLMGEQLEKLQCASPPEHVGKHVTSLFHRKLRCPDLYGAQPEKDAAVLVGVLIGLLLAIPLGMTLFVVWKRGFLFCGASGPASFSRAFYKRTANDDEL